MKSIIHWDDIACTVRINIEKETPRLDFEVFEITGNAEDKETGKYTERMYEKRGATSSEDECYELDDAQTLINGHIKWDACSHVNFGDENGYIHLCGGASWFNFIEAMKRIWEIAIEELPKEHSRDMFDVELFK